MVLVGRWDDKGNWHGLYMMAFKIQVTNGNRQAVTWLGKNTATAGDDNFSSGDKALPRGVAARDSWNYIPIPVNICLWCRWYMILRYLSDILHSGFV
ncbi:hypothetical protein KCP69_21490 [Salmonella enterica subsp. enterica]|nr:hypothetical protein KCP69_21490 [Salmonella enterica subsp. enterica]